MSPTRVSNLEFAFSQDKSNLGNAKTAGLEDTLGLKGDDYNLILSIFFIPYVLAGPVVGMLSKRFGPHRTLPTMMLCFGFSTLMIVAVKNFGGLLALRWILGMVGRSLDAVDVHLEANRLNCQAE